MNERLIELAGKLQNLGFTGNLEVTFAGGVVTAIRKIENIGIPPNSTGPRGPHGEAAELR